MTAVTKERPRTPPRLLVRAFWLIHRAIYRLTGGRVGVWRPKAGTRFGTMRLATVGRRSGQRRIALVGYFEDGPNLITLAMNGWGDAEPAWWLNLQARAHAIVDLPDGRRTVQAREAVGTERERLWLSFRDYPGWGDIDALSHQRARPTAIVVLEPA